MIGNYESFRIERSRWGSFALSAGVVCAWLILGGAAFGQNTLELGVVQGRSVVVLPDRSVDWNIQHVASQLGVKVCIEMSKEAKTKLEIPLGQGNQIGSADIFFGAVEDLGFSIEAYKNTILIRSEDLVNVKENPLDQVVEGYAFSGSCGELLEDIRKLFPGAPPNLSRVGHDQLALKSCEIETTKWVSIRDLLVMFAEQSGIAWMAQVEAEAPTYVIENTETGSTRVTKGSPVTLILR